MRKKACLVFFNPLAYGMFENKESNEVCWTGQDRFGNMTRVYYKDSHGAVIVFDATRPDTYMGAVRWKNDLDSKISLANGKPVPAILVANKVNFANLNQSS